MDHDIERRLQLQAIYAEIENSPVDEKVRERFKTVPYAMKKSKEVKYGENRNIYKEPDRRTDMGS